MNETGQFNDKVDIMRNWLVGDLPIFGLHAQNWMIVVLVLLILSAIYYLLTAHSHGGKHSL